MKKKGEGKRELVRSAISILESGDESMGITLRTSTQIEKRGKRGNVEA